MKQLFCAMYLNKEDEIKFTIEEMKIIKRILLANGLKEVLVDIPYFTSALNSTYYFNESMINKELKINEAMTLYYSDDRLKCLDWLTKKRNKLLNYYTFKYDLIKNSNIIEEDVK